MSFCLFIYEKDLKNPLTKNWGKNAEQTYKTAKLLDAKQNKKCVNNCKNKINIETNMKGKTGNL